MVQGLMPHHPRPKLIVAQGRCKPRMLRFLDIRSTAVACSGLTRLSILHRLPILNCRFEWWYDYRYRQVLRLVSVRESIREK